MGTSLTPRERREWSTLVERLRADDGLSGRVDVSTVLVLLVGVVWFGWWIGHYLGYW